MSPDIAVSLLLGKPKKMKICYFFSQVSGHCVGDARQQYILEAYNLSSVTMVTMGSGLREERQRFLCIQVSQMTRSAEEFDMTEHHESSTIAWIRSTWLFSVKVRTLTCGSLQSCTSSNMAIRTRREISGFRSWTQVPEHPEVCPSKDSRYCLSVGLCVCEFCLWTSQYEDEKRMRNLRPTPFSHTFPLLPLHRNLVQWAFQPASAANPAALPKTPVPHHLSLNLPIPTRHRNCTTWP